jgi:hypothetical protein
MTGPGGAAPPAPPAGFFPAVSDQRKRLAAARRADEGPAHSLDATALVPEAYLRLAWDPTSKRSGRASHLVDGADLGAAGDSRGRAEDADRDAVAVDIEPDVEQGCLRDSGGLGIADTVFHVNRLTGASFIDSTHDPVAFRGLLDEGFRTMPELFPPNFARGYTLKDDRMSAQQGLPSDASSSTMVETTPA